MDSLSPPQGDGFDPMREPMSVAAQLPPPVRRIAVEGAPTVAQPPPGGNGHLAPGAPAPRLKRLPRAETIPARADADRGAEHRLRAEARRQPGLPDRAPGRGAGVDRALGLRQDDAAALPQPPRRPDPDRDPRRADLLDGEDVDLFDVTHLRRRVGMLFQQPNPFPMSIFDNVAYRLRERGSKKPSKRELEPAVTEALHRAASSRRSRTTSTTRRWPSPGPAAAALHRPLAGGASQALAADEPCSALDPISTQTIEETIVALRTEIAIVIVTHNLQQAQRVADHVGFMYLGDLVEYGEAEQVFGSPLAERTREYVSGGFG